MMRTALAALAIAAACSRAQPGPAPLDTRNDACAHCRMAVSDGRFAAQLVAPREEPRFFDDLGCLRDFLKANAPAPEGAVAYVADHRTRAWVRAAAARYTRADALETPMSSHLVAHADGASRAADPEAVRGVQVTVAEVFGPAGVPDGRR